METYLEHTVLKWSIRNYYGFAYSQTQILSSPMFHLGQSGTNWILTLSFEEDEFPWLHLSRCYQDLGCKAIWVSYRFLLKNNSSDVLLCGTREKRFLRTDTHSVRLSTIAIQNLLDKQNASDDDDLTIHCEMYIFLHKTTPKTPSCVEFQSLQRISMYSQSLYNSRELCDVTLRTSEGEVKAHKSILMARSEFFRTKWETKLETAFEIEFPNTPFIALEKIINYMYTGNFEFSVMDRRYIFKIVELVEEFELSCLIEMLFTAEEIHFLTEVEVETYKFTWLLRNYNCDQNFVSPGFSTVNGIWFLTLYPNDSTELKNESKVSLDVVGFKGKVRALAQISVKQLDEKSQLTIEKSTPRTFQKLSFDGSIDFAPSFSEKFYHNCHQHFVPSNALAICASWMICPKDEVLSKSKLIERTTPYGLGDYKVNLLRNLAEDLSLLIKTHSKDLILKTGETVLKAHNANLPARTDVLESVISTNGLYSLYNGVSNLNPSELQSSEISVNNLPEHNANSAAQTDTPESVISTNGLYPLYNGVSNLNPSEFQSSRLLVSVNDLPEHNANSAARTDTPESVISTNGLYSHSNGVSDLNLNEFQSPEVFVIDLPEQNANSAASTGMGSVTSTNGLYSLYNGVSNLKPSEFQSSEVSVNDLLEHNANSAARTDIPGTVISMNGLYSHSHGVLNLNPQ